MQLFRVYLHEIELPRLQIVNNDPDPALLQGKIREVELEQGRDGKYRIKRGLPHVLFLAQQGFQDVWAILNQENL